MIYFIQHGIDGPIKIGFTNRDIKKRMSGLKTGNPFSIHLIGCCHGDRETEHRIHNFFDDLRLNGEWFSPGNKLINFILSFGLFNSEFIPDVEKAMEQDSIITDLKKEYNKKHSLEEINQDCRLQNLIVERFFQDYVSLFNKYVNRQERCFIILKLIHDAWYLRDKNKVSRKQINDSLNESGFDIVDKHTIWKDMDFFVKRHIVESQRGYMPGRYFGLFYSSKKNILLLDI